MGLYLWLGFLLWLGTATLLGARETGVNGKGLTYHLLAVLCYAGLFALLGHLR